MNCTNCGAPMRPVEGRDHCRCDFCNTFRFPEELADSLDRLKPLGQTSKLNCPHCDEPLSLGAIDGVHVHYCATCRGLLVDGESFAHVVRQRRADWTGADVLPAPLDPQQLHRQTFCPHCQRKMDTHAYYGPGNSVIDSCAACRLIWADSGELASIERAPGVR